MNLEKYNITFNNIPFTFAIDTNICLGILLIRTYVWSYTTNKINKS